LHKDTLIRGKVLRSHSSFRSFSAYAGSRETSFDEGAYVLDDGLLEHLIE
jgi:hypothetical protein